MLLILATLTMFTPLASAADCPWAGSDHPAVSATIGGVIVEGKFYKVKGARAKEEFREILTACNAASAIPWFDQWRFYRQAVNVGVASGTAFIVIGAVTLYTAGVVLLPLGGTVLTLETPAAAALAGQDRAAMLSEISRSKAPK